jgi:hypothetical protein
MLILVWLWMLKVLILLLSLLKELLLVLKVILILCRAQRMLLFSGVILDLFI